MKKNIKAARCFLTKALMFGLVLTVCAAVAEAKGRKFGLFVGINEYSGMIPPLGGCVNDAKNMKTTLTAKYGFKAADTTLLTEANLLTCKNCSATRSWKFRVLPQTSAAFSVQLFPRRSEKPSLSGK